MADLVCSAQVDTLMQSLTVPALQGNIGIGVQSPPIVLLSPVTNADVTPNTLMDTGLQFTLTAGVIYRFSFVIPYESALTTTGCRFILDGPAFTRLNYRSMYPLTAGTQTLNYSAVYNFPSACNATSLQVGNLCLIDGVILPSAGGDLKVRFASEISLSGITVLAGSSGTLYTLG